MHTLLKVEKWLWAEWTNRIQTSVKWKWAYTRQSSSHQPQINSRVLVGFSWHFFFISQPKCFCFVLFCFLNDSCFELSIIPSTLSKALSPWTLFFFFFKVNQQLNGFNRRNHTSWTLAGPESWPQLDCDAVAWRQGHDSHQTFVRNITEPEQFSNFLLTVV